MKSRYSTWPHFALQRLKKQVLRRVIAPLIDWKPIVDPQDGYTIIIGCNSPLARMLIANLRQVAAQKLENLKEIIVVFDRPKDQLETPIEEIARKEFPSLPLNFVYYLPGKSATLKKLGWSWIYCWYSWCLAIAHVRTRFVFVHDFDAMLIREDLIEERFRLINGRGVDYLGISNYTSNGWEKQDNFVATFEMMFDVVQLRRQFRPIDLFNKIQNFNGYRIEFDTFQWVQINATRSVSEIDMRGLVHPSQMICQFQEFTRKANFVPPAMNNLLMVPYFLYLSGESTWMNELTRQMAEHSRNADPAVLMYRGKPMDISNLTDTHVQWLKVQMERMETAIAGRVRDEVADYFNHLAARQRRLVRADEVEEEAATVPA